MVLPKHTFSSKTGAIYKTRPPTKALFGCVRDLVLAPPNGKPALGGTPGYLGGRLCTRTGTGTSQVVAENAMRSGKNAKTAKPPVNSCVSRCTIEFLFVRDTSGVEWLGKSSRIAAVLDLAKHQHNTAKSGIASQHGHFHPFCPLYQ